MTQSSPAVDAYVFLSGRPPIPEFMGFIKTMAVDGRDIDQNTLVSEWRSANDRVRDLEQTESGVADNPPVAEIDLSAKPLLEEVLAQPAAQKAFGIVPSQWMTVELDRLVVYQKFINLRYVEELKAEVPTPLGAIELARFSAGLGLAKAEVQISQSALNAFALTSVSEDLRFLDVSLLKPSQVSGYVSPGTTIAMLAVAVGYGPNFITALRIGNRLVLHNGSHRAFALRDIGVTHVPCLVQNVSREDELELLGVPDLPTFADRYIKSVRPALLKDYFDPQLRKMVQVVRKHRLVQVQAVWNQGKVPAT
jgi:hypothetical protein